MEAGPNMAIPNRVPNMGKAAARATSTGTQRGEEKEVAIVVERVVTKAAVASSLGTAAIAGSTAIRRHSAEHWIARWNKGDKAAIRAAGGKEALDHLKNRWRSSIAQAPAMNNKQSNGGWEDFVAT